VNAIEEYSREEWPSYLDSACGDDSDLRHRVELLLEAHAGAESLLDAPAIAPAATFVSSVPEQPGTQIGPYKLLQQIGEGGMGTVFVAEQREPVQRMVALKVIKAGMDSKDVIARFEAERQALAMMNHPHIAKVLDAGTTDSARPFFVMELVKGVPINEYCDQHQLDAKARLELFITVCQAVQHAHLKGIIHRDLKPSNVLVELHDVNAVPKVIDFGVAKATNQRLTQQTLYTGFAQMIGTPLYMSPEQAQLSGMDVDTRSDVYSLGVMLYELLTGTTPFSSEQLSESGIDEMRRIILEEEPARPSQRVSTLRAHKLSTIKDRTPPRQIATPQQLSGELDWIVMKSLEKDRNRRYESASAFAADVQRYLSGAAVQACPPTWSYQLKKFATRHKATLSVSGLVATILVVTSIISFWQAARASAATVTAQHQQQLAETNLDRTLTALDEIYTDVRTIYGMPDTEPQREFHRRGIQFYEEFAEANQENAGARWHTAHAYYRMGAMQGNNEMKREAIESFRSALPLYQDLQESEPENSTALFNQAVLHSRIGWELNYLNEVKAAEQEARLSLEIVDRLSRSHPDNPLFLLAQAQFHKDLGFHLQNAAVVEDRPNGEDSKREFERALELHAEYVRGAPAERSWNDDPQILPLYAGLAVEHQQPHSYSMSYFGLGNWYMNTADWDQATESYQQAAAIQDSLLERDPDNEYLGSQVSETYRRLHVAQANAKRWKEAEAAIRKSVDYAVHLVELAPHRVHFTERAATVLLNLADVQKELDETMDVRQATVRRVLDYCRRTLDIDPASITAWQLSGLAYLKLQQSDECIAAMNQALERTSEGPHRQIFTVYLAVARARRGERQEAQAILDEVAQQVAESGDDPGLQALLKQAQQDLADSQPSTQDSESSNLNAEPSTLNSQP